MQCTVAVILFVIGVTQAHVNRRSSPDGHQNATVRNITYLPFISNVQSKLIDTNKQILFQKWKRTGDGTTCENELQCDCIAPTFDEVVGLLKKCLKDIVDVIKENKGCETDEQNIRDIENCVDGIITKLDQANTDIANNNCSGIKELENSGLGDKSCEAYFDKLSDSTKQKAIDVATSCVGKLSEPLQRLQKEWAECNQGKSTPESAKSNTSNETGEGTAGSNEGSSENRNGKTAAKIKNSRNKSNNTRNKNQAKPEK